MLELLQWDGGQSARLSRRQRKLPRTTLGRPLLLEVLEGRRLLATWTFKIDKGGDDVTLGFSQAASRYEIRDTASGELLASRNATASLTQIKVVGSNSVTDTLGIASTYLSRPLPLEFEAGSGAAVSDTIRAQADADFTLTTSLLTITPDPLHPGLSPAAVTLVGVEKAELIGGSGNDTFDVSDFAPSGGGSVVLRGGAGNDAYIEGCGTLSVSIVDSGGNDDYSLCGSTVTVEDNGGGEDLYTLVSPSSEAPEIDSSITLIDNGDGDDTYFEDCGDRTFSVFDGGGDDDYSLCGSTVTVEDNGGGEDLYTLVSPSPEEAESDSVISLIDNGDGDDTYFEDCGERTFIVLDNGGDDDYSLCGSTVTVEDNGGGEDLYTLTSPEEAETNSQITLTDNGDGDDIYFEDCGERTVEISDGGGDEYYGLCGSTVTVEDNGGENTLDFSSRDEGVSLDLDGDGGTGTGSFFSFKGNFQTVILTDADDTFTLGSTPTGTVVRALGGNDLIDGSTSISDDTIDGGPGNDVMIGGSGNTTFVEAPGSSDVIRDSGGIDTIDFSGASLGIKFNLGLDAGQVQVVDAAANTVAVTGTLEIAIGSEFADDLNGNSFDNVLVGLGGADRLSGHSGRDVLIGGLGDDRLVGGTDEDTLIAGRTIYDRSDAALRAILAEWSTAVLANRVENLRDGSVTLADGTPIVLLKSGTSEFDTTVFDDLNADQVTGSNGPDWLFFDEVLDVVTDEDPGQDVIGDGPVPGV
jgi:transcription elongation GreA/GreB family factor